jgi:hypothetical protein
MGALKRSRMYNVSEGPAIDFQGPLSRLTILSFGHGSLILVKIDFHQNRQITKFQNITILIKIAKSRFRSGRPILIKTWPKSGRPVFIKIGLSQGGFPDSGQISIHFRNPNFGTICQMVPKLGLRYGLSKKQ